jgi:hypothetical protein
VESFDPGSGQGWTYQFAFDAIEGSLFDLVSSIVSDKSARIEVAVPRGAPVALQISLSQGYGRIDLGGLWLSTLELTLQLSGMDLGVSEPLTQPIERIESAATMSGITFRSLGNASPDRLEISHQMGAMELDLTGQWREDARIDVSMNMGMGDILLPSNAHVIRKGAEVDRASSSVTGALPSLTLRTKVKLGALDLARDASGSPNDA